VHLRVNDIGACRRFESAESTFLAEPSGRSTCGRLQGKKAERNIKH